MIALDFFRRLVEANKGTVPAGICSVCSSHPWVIRAAMDQVRDQGNVVLLESTVNQVNQEGGYAKMRPADFRAFVDGLADKAGLPRERVLLGGDHIGPAPWKTLPAAAAMQNACRLAADLVKAGYVKIHLDASAPLAGDRVDPRHGLDPQLAAEREASMAAAAEQAASQFRESRPGPLVYVIGTDVPPPGGARGSLQRVPATTAAGFLETVAACRDAFRRRGLDSAWERVFAVVVQLGAEFGDQTIHDYDRQEAKSVCEAARTEPSLVLEAHSTDYQQPAALRQMVEDGAAVLKVGPALSYALRQTLFALECVEQELAERLPAACSGLRAALDRAMLAEPRHWQGCFDGEGFEIRLARSYSLLDRCRYYWGVPEVEAAARRLISNLRATPIPATLLGQFCPAAYAKLRCGKLSPDPEAIVLGQIADVLEAYCAATGPCQA